MVAISPEKIRAIIRKISRRALRTAHSRIRRAREARPWDRARVNL
jgi:hypothetical protein